MRSFQFNRLTNRFWQPAEKQNKLHKSNTNGFRFESSFSEETEEERNEGYIADSEEKQEEQLEFCEDVNSETEQRHNATKEAELLRQINVGRNKRARSPI